VTSLSGFMGRRVRGAVCAFPLGCTPICLLQASGGLEGPAKRQNGGACTQSDPLETALVPRNQTAQAHLLDVRRIPIRW
jgi:hypothetical protein